MKSKVKNMSKPLIAITMGDAAGIGPEIIIKALGDPSIYQACRPLVIGDAKMLERAKAIVHSSAEVITMQRPEEGKYCAGTINCLDLDLLPVDLPFGKISPEAGDAAYRYLERAIQLATSDEVDAICTAPLNKEAMNLGGHHYPGHTEILAELTHTEFFGMMLASHVLRVILVTIHVGLLDAIESITAENVYRTILLAHRTLQQLGLHSPRVAVCGINPHAGEQGMFGRREEETKIQPAIQRAQAEGIVATGPYPADTVFYKAVKGEFDIVVAMYHDQGLIPIKTLGLEAGVNITVGLPIIRTSVDHGTAFDIAGKGVADEHNLKVAILQAVDLSKQSH
jgi:4-hydroxythreonine-4-phosphate dehydrogenase